jgi:hypothetical protein
MGFRPYALRARGLPRLARGARYAVATGRVQHDVAADLREALV